MKIFPCYVIPEDEIDKLFIEEEMQFLIQACIKDYKVYKSFSEFKTIIKDKYNLWRKNYNEKRGIQ